jgi:hypothetical protein
VTQGSDEVPQTNQPKAKADDKLDFPPDRGALALRPFSLETLDIKTSNQKE